MKRLSNALIVGVLGFVIQTWSASAQYTIATNEPLIVVAGQTQVRFTGYYQAYVRSFSCASITMNYLQGVVIENRGLPGPTGNPAQVLTDLVGPTGHLFIVCASFSCDGYQFLDLEAGGCGQ